MATNEPDWDLLSSYAGLLTLATVSIYVGSHGSVTVRRSNKAKGKAVDPGEDEDEDEDIPERLSSTDAYLFPVIGSVVLFGLYLIVKYFGEEWINWLLQWYFIFTGIGSVSRSLISLARWTVGSARWKKFEKTQLLFLKGSRELASVSLRTPSWFLIPLGALPSVLYSFGPSTTRRSALLTDLLALSFSHNALSLLKIDSFKTGCVMLSGLFLYDIWWVFGTEVMVKVATTLDVPIKIIWPKSLIFSTERGFTMLGLGDIVVPGLFIALALRYDFHRSAQTAAGGSYTKPYFYSAIVSYVLGLSTTMFIMHFFKTAQPALLYLSPSCIVSFLLTALVTGDFARAWAWSDDPEGKEDAATPALEGDSSTPTLSKATEDSSSGKSAGRSSTPPVSDSNGTENGAQKQPKKTKH